MMPHSDPRNTIDELVTPDKRYRVLATVARLYSNVESPKLQEGLLTDNTGTIHFVQWADSDTPPLELHKTYHFKDVRLNVYRGLHELQIDVDSSFELVFGHPGFLDRTWSPVASRAARVGADAAAGAVTGELEDNRAGLGAIKLDVDAVTLDVNALREETERLRTQVNLLSASALSSEHTLRQVEVACNELREGNAELRSTVSELSEAVGEIKVAQSRLSLQQRADMQAAIEDAVKVRERSNSLYERFLRHRLNLRPPKFKSSPPANDGMMLFLWRYLRSVIYFVPPLIIVCLILWMLARTFSSH